jgi:hypothetical protein
MGPFIQPALSLRQAPRPHGDNCAIHNVCIMPTAYNQYLAVPCSTLQYLAVPCSTLQQPLVWRDASNQRTADGAVWAGSGNGDPSAVGSAAVSFGFLGFFGFSIFRAPFGGGPAG